MCFILSFSCDFLNFFVFSFFFFFPLQFFSLTSVFSHNFWFSILQVLQKAKSFLSSVEISRLANFHNM